MDAKQIHDLDQVVAAFGTLAAALAKAYVELIGGGVPAEHAVQIVVQMAANLRQAPPA